MEKMLKRRAGVLVPLFSVYSKNSMGVGDLEDLKLLIDWSRETGYSIIQLLPMNEIGSTLCPYDSISSFALEPMYVRLKPSRSGSGKTPGVQGESHVDYRVKEEKLRILWDLYTKEKDIASNKEFSLFVEENSYWIDDYSLFKALKSYHNRAPWHEWDDRYKDRDGYAIEQFKKSTEKSWIFINGSSGFCLSSSRM